MTQVNSYMLRVRTAPIRIIQTAADAIEQHALERQAIQSISHLETQPHTNGRRYATVFFTIKTTEQNFTVGFANVPKSMQYDVLLTLARYRNALTAWLKENETGLIAAGFGQLEAVNYER